MELTHLVLIVLVLVSLGLSGWALYRSRRLIVTREPGEVEKPIVLHTPFTLALVNKKGELMSEVHLHQGKRPAKYTYGGHTFTDTGQIRDHAFVYMSN